MSRLLTFGCSFTNYHWSTWADILAPEYDCFHNWGSPGGGNHYIFNSLMEADQHHKFGPGDTVIVCWTNVMREDRYVDGRGWITLGNITTSKIYTKEFVADLVTERGCAIRDLAMIKAAKVLLESRPGVNWKFLSMCPLQQIDAYDTKTIECYDVFDLYRDVVDCVLPSYMEVLGQNYWITNKDQRLNYGEGHPDYHPTPLEHLKYIETVLPESVISQSTRNSIIAESQNLRKIGITHPNVSRL